MDATRYAIDADDRITSVGGAWEQFALDNGAPGLRATDVIGRSLWTFTAGAEVRHVYEMLFARLRHDITSCVVPFRCDGPFALRRMELSMARAPEDGIRMAARVLRIAEHAPRLGLLDAGVGRGATAVRICSWCKQVCVGSRWVPIELAARRMGLFEGDAMPLLTHGACPSCVESLIGA